MKIGGMPKMTGMETGYPRIVAPVQKTEKNTYYLDEPGVHLLAKPSIDVESMRDFLSGFSSNLKFEDYTNDPSPLPSGAQLCKLAGQLCYASFGPGRTTNADAERYFNNIRGQGHGSVLEHANYTFLFYGVSRSLTHELIRHRAGFGYSQISQRYVSGRVLRFVERPEYVSDPELHEIFLGRIDRTAHEYESMAEALLGRQKAGSDTLHGGARTDLRKRVQQTARSLLTNETEAPIIVTGNARAWRHLIEMRASEHAEVEIRRLAHRVYLCLAATDPILFGDYETLELQDGTVTVRTVNPKV